MTAPVVTIPRLPVQAKLGLETLEAAADRTHALLDGATRGIPAVALRWGDALSRRWLARSRNPYLDEIDTVAAHLKRPGVYYFSISYEWGCTCRVGPGEGKDHADGRPRLVRVLDWPTPGLGRHVVAAEVAAPAGIYIAMTWPGYTGVLQGLAPGRFAAAINQAPMRPLGGGFLASDWLMNRYRVWRLGHVPAAHLLRRVFETATTYREAKHQLTTVPIAAPAIFSLAGLEPGETAVIERTEHEARTHNGPSVAANHWQSVGWVGRERGRDSHGRARRLASSTIPDFDPAMPWLQAPVLNPLTRLAMVASAAERQLLAVGYERDGAATAPFTWTG